MEVIFKLGLVCTLILSLSHKGLSQKYPPRFDPFPSLVVFNESCSNRTLATITARGSNGVITISANDDATRDKVNIIQTSSSNSDPYTTTVQIKQKACMDRETEPTWYLHLLADDTSNLKTIQTLQIYILDVNDEEPSFSSKLFQITEFENASLSTEVLKVVATDPDNGVGGVVTYSLQAQGQSSALYDGAFDIDRNTGSITVQKKLDYSKLSFYQYLVFGTDGDGLKGNATLIIKIQDIQNKPPYFTGQPYNAEIPEESPVGTSVNFPYHIRADDGDTGVPHAIEYNFTEGECNHFFEINSNGAVTVKERIDRDAGVIHKFRGVCTLTLMALEKVDASETDPGPSNSTTPVVITITDIDDNLPKFLLSIYNATVFENLVQVPLTIEGDRINVTDVDQNTNSRLHLELQYDNGTTVKGINPVPDMVQGSGNIMLYLQDDFSFDFEKVQNISYTLVASEEEEPAKAAHCTVHLEIIDRNDNLPQFTNSSFVVHIEENNTNVQQVLSEKATDKDSGEFGEITYSLRGGVEIFVVNNVTGHITKRENKTLDYEKRDEYVLTLVAKDGGGSLQPAEVIVKINDINDNPPVFTQSSYISFVAENKTNFEMNVSASDRDQKNTNNSRVEFSLIDSPFQMENNFTISTIQQSDEFLGNISLKGSLDYEKLNDTAKGQVTLYVLAKDFGNPSLNSTCTVIINIQDLNDNTPVFNPPDYKENIFENATYGSYVGNVTATDKDGTEANKDLSYYIITGSGLFRINGKSGEITVNLNAGFDREATAAYNLTIVAVDRGTPPRTGNTNVTVVIDDVNDTPPKFDKDIFVASVLENKTAGSSVKTCSAKDEDLDFHLIYKIFDLQTSQSANYTVKNWFRINNATGEVTVHSALDREVTDTVILTLTVEDLNAATSISQTATATLTVSILDVNDNDPVFPENYYVNITEGKISGPVITVTATDPDKNPTITYRIAKNYLTDTFSIGPTTGQISRNNLKDVDRETTPYFDIEVEANDTVFINTTKVFITVLDVNDNPPVFRLKHYNKNLTENNGTDLENIHNSTLIVWFNASDKDEGPNAELTYKLIDDFGKFEIDNITGRVTATGHFDRENKINYNLEVTVNDNALDTDERQTSTATITIKITDVNDNVPYFPQENYNAIVREDRDPNYSIIAVTAKDRDINQTFKYSIELETNRQSLFRINEHTGLISVNASLYFNYGTKELTVWVEDIGGLKNSTSVSINVEDINDNAPVFNDLQSFYKIYECAKVGSNVTILNTTDADYGVNKEVSYTFVDQSGTGKNHSDFLLNDITGEITTAKNLSADGDYILRVKAYDHGTPVLSTMVDIEIRIVDVNDHPPTFPHTTENASVPENTQNVVVTTVKAEDIDKDSIIEYKIKKDDSKSFTIDPIDGTIKIIKELDRENTTNAMVSLVIEAVDTSGTTASDQCYDSIFSQNNSTTTIVNIKILDQNDNPPIFKSSFISIGVRRTITTGKTEAFIFDLKESVEPDPDSEQYSVHQFKVNGKYTYSSDTLLEQKIQELLNTNKIKACTGNNEKTPICVTGNGTVNTNIQLEENMKGYINIPLIVKDAAGNSTTELRIYIISDYQTGSILINGNKEYVQSIKADLMRILTQLTGQNFTADGIRPFNTGTFQSTYLDFHVADPKTGTILSAKDAIQLFDKYSSQLGVILKQYSILAAKTYTETQAQDDEGGIKTTYIMIAVIALLGATNLLIGFFFCSSASRYQRKLKAATTKSTVDQDKGGTETHPGTNVYARNQNPLLNKDGEFTNIDYDRFADDASVASFDSNQFTKKEPVRGDEEKGATMDMYDDEREVQQGENESLAMVLDQYKKEKAASRESLVPSEMHNGHLHSDDFTHSFDNDGLELSLETTEV